MENFFKRPAFDALTTKGEDRERRVIGLKGKLNSSDAARTTMGVGAQLRTWSALPNAFTTSPLVLGVEVPSFISRGWELAVPSSWQTVRQNATNYTQDSIIHARVRESRNCWWGVKIAGLGDGIKTPTAGVPAESQ